MDSNSDSFDMSFPKIEIDSDCETTAYKRESRYNWNSENTMKLIDTMEKECKELWDVKHPSNKDRVARQAKMEYLANLFGTSSEEISRKIHNLRTQFNNELRKIKRRSGSEGGMVAGSSGWEYFDALTFLLRAPPDPLDSVDAVNLALAEFQANEEVKFGIAARANINDANINNPNGNNPNVDNADINNANVNNDNINNDNINNVNINNANINNTKINNANINKTNINNAIINTGTNNNNNSPTRRGKHTTSRVAVSAPPPLPPSAYPLMWPEEMVPWITPGIRPDDCQVFGHFVASELRTLRSIMLRRKLKRMIQKAILQVCEEEDVNLIRE